MAIVTVSISLAVAVLAGLVYQLLQVGRRPKGMPPGPATLPIVGNLHQLPAKDLHVKLREWAQEYGEIYSIMLGNQRMVVLNSPRVVKDLIDQRSNNYSSRPEMYVGQTLISGGYRLVLMQYDEGWRLARKMIHNLLNIKTAVEYIPYQELELRQMLADMVKRPDKYHDHVRRYSTSLVTSITFGWRSLAFNDPDVKAIYEVSEPNSGDRERNGALMGSWPGFRRVCSRITGFGFDAGLFPHSAELARLYEPEQEKGQGIAQRGNRPVQALHAESKRAKGEGHHR